MDNLSTCAAGDLWGGLRAGKAEDPQEGGLYPGLNLQPIFRPPWPHPSSRVLSAESVPVVSPYPLTWPTSPCLQVPTYLPLLSHPLPRDFLLFSLTAHWS